MQNENLNRTIDWKQGLSIAIGVPLLILPSITTLTTYVGSLSILLWSISVIQGFLQNIAYAEMATMFPKASGLPGYSQSVFGDSTTIGKFIGGFSAWSYWLAWNPVLSIYTLLITELIVQMFPFLSNYSYTILALIIGTIIFSILIYVNLLGLSNSAKLGYILAFISLVPLFIICIYPYINGKFLISNITSNSISSSLNINIKKIMLLLGLMATAQWSACAWETAAVYGPEYKDPKNDILKALFSCGFICLLIYIFVQTSVIGTLGVEFIINNQNVSPLFYMSNISFGKTGNLISMITLITSMILIIQTAFAGSSRSLYSMSREGNLPKFFGKLTKNGTPLNSLIFIAIFNLLLIVIFSKGNLGSASILSASAFGYIFSNCISLYSYYRASKDPKFKNIDRPFKAPFFWKYISLFFSILNIPFYLLGIIYLNYIDFGMYPIILGFIVLLSYFILFYISNTKKDI